MLAARNLNNLPLKIRDELGIEIENVKNFSNNLAPFFMSHKLGGNILGYVQKLKINSLHKLKIIGGGSDGWLIFG